jgi:hypothetical protein
LNRQVISLRTGYLSTKLKPKNNLNAYELRSSSQECLEASVIRSKFGEWTFENYFVKLLNKVKISRDLFFINDYNLFNIYLLTNLDNLVIDIIGKFFKFDICVNFAHIYY